MALPGQGEYHSAAPNSSALAGSTAVDTGTTVAGQFFFPGGVSLFSGFGVPGSRVNGKPGVVGDIYIRLDGAVGSLIYRCTVAPGTWVVVL